MGRSYWFMWKKGFKTISKNKAKTIPIILLMAVTIGLGATLFDMQDIRGRLVEKTIEDTKFADGFIFFDPVPRTNLTILISNVSSEYFKDFEFRMALLIQFDIDGEKYDGLLMGIDTKLDSHINALLDENFEEIDDYDFCLNWNFANEQSIKKGDELILTLGSIEKKVDVENIGFNPEFLYSSLYENVVFPSIKPYPILYVDIEYLNDHFINQSSAMVNQILYKLKKDVDQEDVEDKVEDYMGTYIHEIITQDDYPFVKVSREDEEQDRQFFMIYISIFIIGSIITLIIVINKLIDNDLKSVSVFQGLGSYKGEIIGGYLIFNTIILLISLVFGCIVNFLANIPINILVMENLGIPISNYLYFSIYNNLIIATILLCVSLLSTYIFAKKSFKMDVQETLKHEYEFVEKSNLMERIVLSVRKTLHPFTKYNLRRIFGRKIYIFFIFLGLSMSFCIIMLSYGYPDSMKFSVDKKLNEIERWDAVATTWNYEDESTLDIIFGNIPEIDSFEFGITDTLLMSKKASKFENNIRILAYEDDSKLHKIETESEVELSKKTDALVSKDMIKDYEIEIGDQIYVKNIASNNSFKIKIIGSVNDMTTDTIFMTIKGAQEVLEVGNGINIIYLTTDEMHKVSKEVQDLPQIESVIEKESLKEEFEMFTEMFLIIFLIMGTILTVFGLALISIILKAIVEYRLEDYGNMKALGLHDSEIRKSLLQEVGFYLLISLPFGLTLGLLITFMVVQQYSFLLPGFFFNIYPISYLYLSINVGFIISVSLFIQFRKIKGMNISEVTKMKTFG